VGIRGSSIKEQIKNYNHNIQEFVKCIESLPEHLFLGKIDDWTPRDITAHLIGWNFWTVTGCHQIKDGETPAYFIDPGDDFCNVNAVLVRRYNSRDKKELITQLKSSGEKLADFLTTLDPQDWDADSGVTWQGETVTIKNTIEALTNDFTNHRRQIEKWVEEETD
jgi:hypothetical protein